jgi:hypothetical protein
LRETPLYLKEKELYLYSTIVSTICALSGFNGRAGKLTRVEVLRKAENQLMTNSDEEKFQIPKRAVIIQVVHCVKKLDEQLQM